jgi:hypothetical protein
LEPAEGRRKSRSGGEEVQTEFQVRNGNEVGIIRNPADDEGNSGSDEDGFRI